MVGFRKLRLIFEFNKLFWLMMGAILTLNLLFHLMMVQPKRHAVERLRSDYREIREKDLQSVDRDGAVKEFLRSRERVQTFRKALPEESVSGEVSEEINALIRQNHIATEPVLFKPEGIVDLLLLRYAADLTLKGPYSRLKQLLADIQNSPRLFCIENLSFENSPLQEEGVTLRLSISTYFRGSLQLPSSG